MSATPRSDRAIDRALAGDGHDLRHLCRELERDHNDAMEALRKIADAKTLDDARWAANSAVSRLTPISFPAE
jgi:hypothetical protein